MFTDAKTIDSRALNRAGAQPFRAALGRFLYKLRPGSADPMIAELCDTGILVCENFLPPDAFVAVQREAEAFMDEREPTVVNHWGTTELRHYFLIEQNVDRYSMQKNIDRKEFPHLVEWRHNQQVLALATGAERRTCRDHHGAALLEHLTFGDYSAPDTQTELHIDTFHNTHRVWLYLDDVTEDNAPFVYVPGSHHLDRVRLREEYLESTGGNGKSRRIHDEELRSRGLQTRTVVTCPRNTLVVANTCGYHCRSMGRPGATRRALHMTFRFNPFSLQPFVSSFKSSIKRSPARIDAPSSGGVVEEEQIAV
jgi:ectoine hydroxylase-related dioxygenase (phytanoyl-CoA dioxygenase family)